MPLSNCTVTLRSVSTTRDDLGDGTTTTTDTPLEWALIAPRSSSERADQSAPAVITAASILLPFDVAIDSDDTLIVSNHSHAFNGEWQVEGIPGPWALGEWKPGQEIAIKRAGSV